MSKKISTLVKLFIILAIGCVIEVASATNWGYTGSAGPTYWGSLNASYKLCKSGQEQSPIDIGKATPLHDDHFSLHYHTALFDLNESNNNLYQYSLKLRKNYVVYNGRKYNLIQIHFHVPSEHKLNNQAYPMEAHLVHKSAEGDLLVLGVFFKVDDSNDYFSDLFESKPFAEQQEELVSPVKLNPADLVGSVKKYYVYQGSLTTPPCAEGVTWIIAKNPSELSSKQLATFKDKITPFNARPMQALHGRSVGCEGC